MDSSFTRYSFAFFGAGVGVGAGAGVGAGDEAIGCCSGIIFIGFIDAGDFVVVGLLLWQCRSISRRSRRSPRFPYMLNLLFPCRLERERRCLARLLCYGLWLFFL
jgi:hypothetical protein